VPWLLVQTSGYQGGPSTVEATFLPARAAYLIRAGSRDGMRRAVQEASTRWAGVTEPIIPLRRDGRIGGWYRQLVSILRVDGLIDVDAGNELAVTASRVLGLPQTPIKYIDRSGITQFTAYPMLLPPVQEANPPVMACAGAPLWQAVVAGDLDPEHEEDAAKEGLLPRRPLSEDQVVWAAIHGNTLLDQTAVHFSENSATNGPYPIPATIWVTGRRSLVDCLFFWNIRTLKPRLLAQAPMLLLPLDGAQHWLGLAQQVRSLLRRYDEFSPDVNLCSAGASANDLDRIAALLELEHSSEKPRVGRKWPAEFRQQPYTYMTNMDPRQWLMFGRTFGEKVEVEAHAASGKARLRISSPVRLRGGGTTLVRLDSELFKALPRRSEVAASVLPNAEWRDGSLQFATSLASEYRFEISVPALEDATSLILSSVCERHHLSDKGRLASILMSEALDETLLSERTVAAIASLATPRSKELERELVAARGRGDDAAALTELAMQWGGRAERRYRAGGDLADLLGRSLKPLEDLCRIGWAERGCETQCGRCGLRSFVPLGSVDGPATCPGCRTPAKYSTVGLNPKIFYRLNSFIDRASDQGVIPHLATISHLRQESRSHYLLGGVNFEFRGGRQAEADIVGLIDSRLILGEVKTNGSEFTERQVDHDVSIATAVGADLYVMSAMNKIPRNSRDYASRVARRARIGLSVLDGLGESTIKPKSRRSRKPKRKYS
jgi:hypothetical protein